MLNKAIGAKSKFLFLELRKRFQFNTRIIVIRKSYVCENMNVTVYKMWLWLYTPQYNGLSEL